MCRTKEEDEEEEEKATELFITQRTLSLLCAAAATEHLQTDPGPAGRAQIQFFVPLGRGPNVQTNSFSCISLVLVTVNVCLLVMF